MDISGVVIALNESAKIEACVRSLQRVCKEVIVLDSGSQDDTVARCEQLGAKVFYHPFEGHIQQKNQALTYALGPYVLSLDADEILSEDLIHSISEALSKNTGPIAYRMPRLNRYCGQWIRYGAWNPDRKIRLWPLGKAHWGGHNPHDRVITPPDLPIVDLQGSILHFSYDTPEELRIQCNKFATIAARERLAHERRSMAWPLPRAIFRWVRDILFKRGFLDGKAGWKIAYENARYTYLKYSLKP
jgi:glycosyltransferase involved in cell wall biosynthesis